MELTDEEGHSILDEWLSTGPEDEWSRLELLKYAYTRGFNDALKRLDEAVGLTERSAGMLYHWGEECRDGDRGECWVHSQDNPCPVWIIKRLLSACRSLKKEG